MTIKSIIGSMPWQVTVSAGDERSKVEWCESHIGQKVVRDIGFMWRQVQPTVNWSVNEIWVFRNQEDAVLFYMTWHKDRRDVEI